MSRPRVDPLTGVLSFVIPSLLVGVVVGCPGVAAAASCPSLTIMLERSGSMLWDLAGHAGVADPAKQRWGIAKAALERAVAAYNNKLPIGLTLFPSDDLCGTSGTLRVPPGYDTQAAIHAALSDGSNSPNGGGHPDLRRGPAGSARARRPEPRVLPAASDRRDAELRCDLRH